MSSASERFHRSLLGKKSPLSLFRKGGKGRQRGERRRLSFPRKRESRLVPLKAGNNETETWIPAFAGMESNSFIEDL